MVQQAKTSKVMQKLFGKLGLAREEAEATAAEAQTEENPMAQAFAGGDAINLEDLSNVQRLEMQQIMKEAGGADTMEELMQMQAEMSAVIGAPVDMDDAMATFTDAQTAADAASAAQRAEFEARGVRTAEPATPGPIPLPGGGAGGTTVVKVYIDGREFMAAIAGQEGVPGVIVETVQDALGGSLATQEMLKAATGL